MAATVVDTNVLIAYADSDDPHHVDATTIVDGIDAGELPPGHVTDYVVAETLNYVGERDHHDTAVDLSHRLDRSAGLELVETASSDVASGIELFERYPDLSFVDATTAAYMRRSGVEYLYSFDDDFDALDGITRLTSGLDPFG